MIGRIIVVAMVLGALVIGCTHTQSKTRWVLLKDGKEVPSEQIQKIYRECHGPDWIKDSITDEESHKDYDICLNISIERDRYKKNISNALSMGFFIPFVGIALTAAAATVEATGGLSVARCMETKGYSKAPRKRQEDVDECIASQGYEWKEIERYQQ